MRFLGLLIVKLSQIHPLERNSVSEQYYAERLRRVGFDIVGSWPANQRWPKSKWLQNRQLLLVMEHAWKFREQGFPHVPRVDYICGLTLESIPEYPLIPIRNRVRTSNTEFIQDLDLKLVMNTSRLYQPNTLAIISCVPVPWMPRTRPPERDSVRWISHPECGVMIRESRGRPLTKLVLDLVNKVPEW